MFEIPSDLNPALVGLAWLRGRWEGTGYRQWPGEEKTSYSIQIDFADNGGDYLHYLSQSFEVDDEGRPVKALAMEAGASSMAGAVTGGVLSIAVALLVAAILEPAVRDRLRRLLDIPQAAFSGRPAFSTLYRSGGTV